MSRAESRQTMSTYGRPMTPDLREEGYLNLVAMEKKGVWGTEGVPIEYARFQTQHPGKVA